MTMPKQFRPSWLPSIKDNAQAYDRHRDPAHVKFYHSANWKRFRKVKLSINPTCERCGRCLGQLIHHLYDPIDFPEFAYSIAHTQTLDIVCHNQIHFSKGEELDD
jgi:hypothetical protein